MNPLLAILRAAHCRSTHHYFAIDAIPLVQTGAGKRLVSHLLKHHDAYLSGATDPDTRFRDFHNHIVHVRQGYWGGAPRVAHQWYDRLQRFLRDGHYRDAAHASGVISHYFTDPIQPMHTAQSPREKVLHRPIEWSIRCGYQDIFTRWQRDDCRIVFQLAEGPGWLGDAILHAAKFSHTRYETLLDHYRLDLAIADPAAALDDDAKTSLSDLLGIAVTGWARVIERMALETEAMIRRPLPTAPVSLAMILASLRVPHRLWLRRITDKVQRREVAQMVDEFNATGDVVRHLPHECDVVERVMRVRDDEERWRESRLAKVRRNQTRIDVHADANAEATEPAILPFAAAQRATVENAADGSKALPSLSPADDLVRAASIGPKTAARFAQIGITTVAQFLAAEPARMEARLATRWITVATLNHWQSQAGLMCRMPALSAREAQLLVGAGCRSVADIARADATTLHDALLRYASTAAGSRHLRDESPPDAGRIGQWIQAAATLHAADRLPATLPLSRRDESSPRTLRRAA